MRRSVLWLLAAVACGKSMAGNGLGSNPAGPPDGPPRPPDSSPPVPLDGPAGLLDGPPRPLDGPPGPLDGPPGPPDALPPGYDQWAAVCGKHYGDAISAALCAGNQPPRITSIAELEQRLGMNRNNSTLSITGLSTGMGLHMVTPFNPNAILVKTIFPARYMVLAFARGEPLVELVANDSQTLRFFAIRFTPRARRRAATPLTC